MEGKQNCLLRLTESITVTCKLQSAKKNKEKKKSLTTMITAVTVAQIPVIISALISLINLLSSSAYKITSPISSLCSAISIVLTYFAVKFVFNKKDEEAIKTFVLVEVIYIVVAFILSFIGIYI